MVIKEAEAGEVLIVKLSAADFNNRLDVFPPLGCLVRRGVMDFLSAKYISYQLMSLIPVTL